MPFLSPQIEVLEESKIMIPDCKRRIKAAYNELQTLVVSDYFSCSFCKNMSFLQSRLKVNAF